MKRLVLVLVAGCRSVLGIEDVTGDIAADNDEDVDGFLDFADNCPTASNPDQRDNDADGVGDACDPDPVALNRIAFYSAMLDARGISTPVVFGDSFAQVSGFPVSLADQYRPVRVEAEVAFVTQSVNDNLGIEIDVGANLVWTCFAIINATPCGGIGCLQIKLPTASAVQAGYSRTSLISRLVFDTRLNGTASCTGFADPEQKEVTDAGTIISTGFVRFRASNAKLFSLVVYE